MKNMCPKCGYANEEGARFCPKCGAFIKVQKTKTNELTANEQSKKEVYSETQNSKLNQSSTIEKENNANSATNTENSKRIQTRKSCFGDLWGKPQTKNNVPDREPPSHSESFDDYGYEDSDGVQNSNSSLDYSIYNSNKPSSNTVSYKDSLNANSNKESKQIKKYKNNESSYEDIDETEVENQQVFSKEGAEESKKKIVQGNTGIIKNHLIFTCLIWILLLVTVLVAYFVPFIKYTMVFYSSYGTSYVVVDVSLLDCTVSFIQLLKVVIDSISNMDNSFSYYLTIILELRFAMILVILLFVLMVISIVKIVKSSKDLSNLKKYGDVFYYDFVNKNKQTFSKNYKSKPKMFVRLIFSIAWIFILPLINKISVFTLAIPINGYNIYFIFVAIPLVGLVTLYILDFVKLQPLKKKLIEFEINKV